jgi:hypothetical protein
MVSRADGDVAGSDGVFRQLKTALEGVTGAGGLRRTLVVALLLAFSLQAQLAASHFHLAGAAITLADAGKDAPSKDQKKPPADDDCPICQQLASAHSFLFPAAVSVSLPELVAAQAFVVREAQATVPLVALGWQSRAPPL